MEYMVNINERADYMSGNQFPDNENPTANAETVEAVRELVATQLGWINEAAEIIGKPVEEAFPLPPEVRREAPDPEWTAEQEAGVRAIAHRLGYGAEMNVPSGLEGGARLLQGGLAWKIAAELTALSSEDNPAAVVFSGSPNRRVNGDEQSFMAQQLGIEVLKDATEYALARLFAERMVVERAERNVAFGYDLNQDNSTNGASTGQLVYLGKSVAGQDVYVLRVDRENYTDDGKSKYRFQPTPERLMGMVAEALAIDSPGNHQPLGFMTSNAYAANQIEAIRAGLKYGQRFAVGMYGRATLAAVRGIDMLPDVELNQVPGDLRVTYENLRKLQAELPNQ